MDLSLVFVLANPSQSHTRTTGMMSRVLTVVLLAMVAPVRAAIVKGTGILKELGRATNCERADRRFCSHMWSLGDDA